MKTGVVLLAHGTPDSPDDMEAYLRRVMKQRAPTPAFVEEIRSRYRRIGGQSPLTEITIAQAESLSRRLDLPAAVGMLHGKPTIEDAVRSLGADRAIGICAAPHHAPITTNAYREALRSAAPSARFIESWHRQPEFLDAWAERVRGASFVLFTAHSIPVQGADPYPVQLRETISGIVDRAPGLPWDLAYQSRSPSPVPWLEPGVDAALDELHARDIPEVLVAPIGFVADNVEILYDLDVLHSEHAFRLGIRWSRAPLLNTDPRLIEALAAAVRETIR